MSGETMNTDHQSPANNEWESLTEQNENKQKEVLTFQVAPGISKEAEFKRLTGEDWPGVNFIAETDGVDDDGYDYPIENWVIRRRNPTTEATPNPDTEESPSLNDELQAILERKERGEEDEFAGERNINDATGKKRTNKLFDLYPQEKGESHDHYVARLHRMRELTEQFEKEKLAALEHEKDVVSAEEKEKLDRLEREKAIANLAEATEAEQNELEKEQLATAITKLETASKEEDPSINEIFKRIDEKTELARVERLKELGAKLDEIRPDLAELYAKSRRLIVFPKTKAEFARVKAEYGQLMDEYLKLQAESTYEHGKNSLSVQLEKKFNSLKEGIESQLAEFAGGDLENTEKSSEEIESMRTHLLKTASEALKMEWQERTGQLESYVNVKFLENFLEQENMLEDATIEQLDNGTLCRKFVSKVIGNKYLKGALIGAGIAGLAITGVGLGMGIAAGTASIGFGLTASGAAAGAGRGALAGALLSRQSSKNSAVRGFASEADIREQLKDINALDKNSATGNVADWLLSQYETAKDADLSSNRKRTAVSVGLGTALGAILSGIQIGQNVNQTHIETEQIGVTPAEYQYQAANLNNVNIPEGHGISTTFQQLGGNLDDPAAFNQFESIVHDIGYNYGLVPSDNGIVGAFAHTYPGTIDSWPAEAQAYITEVANEAARQGLIPANTVQVGGGQAIYGPVERVVQTIVPDAFMNFLAQATATTGIAVGASGFSSRQNRNPSINNPNIPTQQPIEEMPSPIPQDSVEISSESSVANTSSETTSPEEPADIGANEAARTFESLNDGRVSFNPDYYGKNNGAIVTDVNPADLNYPDGWYYAKGALRNKHNTTNGVYEEISMIKPDGTPWPSTFTAGNTPLSTSQSSSENPGTTPESVESNSESVAAPVSTETTPEMVTNSEERPTAQEVAPLDNLSEKDQRLNEITNSVNLELLRNRFRNILDENGIEILAMDPISLSNTEQLNQANNRFGDWWAGLNEDQRNAVSQFVEETKDSDFGGAFRNWFNSPTAQEIINGNNSDA